MRRLWILVALLAGMIGAQASHGNDFPTLARVEYVIACMNRLGNQNYDNLYKCVCSVDLIAERMSYDDFAEAQAFTMLRSTPGERGGVFRDPPTATHRRNQLADAEAEAQTRCFPSNKTD